MNYRIVYCLLAVFLVACNQDYSVEYLREHPEKANQLHQQCQRDKQAKYCPHVAQAITTISGLALQMKANPQAFGQSIMKQQNQIVALKAKINATQDAAEKAAFKQQLTDIEQKNRQYLAIVAWLSAPSI